MNEQARRIGLRRGDIAAITNRNLATCATACTGTADTHRDGCAAQKASAARGRDRQTTIATTTTDGLREKTSRALSQSANTAIHARVAQVTKRIKSAHIHRAAHTTQAAAAAHRNGERPRNRSAGSRRRNRVTASAAAAADGLENHSCGILLLCLNNAHAARSLRKRRRSTRATRATAAAQRNRNGRSRTGRHLNRSTTCSAATTHRLRKKSRGTLSRRRNHRPGIRVLALQRHIDIAACTATSGRAADGHSDESRDGSCAAAIAAAAADGLRKDTRGIIAQRRNRARLFHRHRRTRAAARPAAAHGHHSASRSAVAAAAADALCDHAARLALLRENRPVVFHRDRAAVACRCTVAADGHQAAAIISRTATAAHALGKNRI